MRKSRSDDQKTVLAGPIEAPSSPERNFGSINPLKNLEVKYSPSYWWKLKMEAKYSAFYWLEAKYVTESLSSVLESLLSASKIPL